MDVLNTVTPPPNYLFFEEYGYDNLRSIKLTNGLRTESNQRSSLDRSTKVSCQKKNEIPNN